MQMMYLIADLVMGMGLDMNNPSALVLRDADNTGYHRQTHLTQVDLRLMFLLSQPPKY